MTTTERWLSDAAAPGRGRLRLAATFQWLETVCTIVQWAGLAWFAQGALHGQLAWSGLFVMVAGGVLAGGMGWCAARCQADGRRRISRAIRQRLVAALLPTTRRRGDPDAAAAALATVELTDDVADHHADAVPLRLSAPASMAVVFLVTAVVQWPAAVILLLASLLIPLNMRLAGLFAKEGAEERLVASTRLTAVVLDSFRGMRTLRSIGALERRRGRLEAATGRLNTTTMAVVRRGFLSGSVMEVVIMFSIAANATYIGLSLLGYVRLAGAPPVSLFSGLLALLLCPMYFAPFRAMAAAHHSRERAVAAVPAITGLLTDPPPPEDTRVALPPAGPVTVALIGASHRFPGADPVLQDLDVAAPAARWTAVVGPSGAGKTTLLSLIAGMHPPATGTVRWVTADGGVAPYLGGCAWIGQQTVILPGTIYDNIRIGCPAAGRREVEHAALTAGLADVVARLPDGLATHLGEGGSGISTGEARRIAIARAFLSDAWLWVLDEPTAHLDPHSEAQVIDALRHATLGRTVVVATHSAALAHAADTVLAIADGTVHPVREVLPT
jgi:ATP-binding cassette subfamily C protein CydD